MVSNEFFSKFTSGTNLSKENFVTLAAYGSMCLCMCHDAVSTGDTDYLKDNSVKVLHAGLFAKLRELA